MRQLLGIFLILVGIVGGLYLGVYLMFIGGIIQVIKSVTPIIIASGIAIGIARIMFASFVGWLTFIVCVAIGKSLL